MHSEDYSARYTAFLRSGSYPAVSALLTKRNEWSRYAGLLALAGAAGSAGYMTTLWLVPMPGVETAPIHASVASMAPPPKQVPPGPQPLTAAEVAPIKIANALELAPTANRTNRREPQAPRVTRAGANAMHSPSAAQAEPVQRATRTAAPQLMAAAPHAAAEPAHHAHDGASDALDLDDLHAELEAERARAREEALHAEAIAQQSVAHLPMPAPIASQPAKPVAARAQPAKLWPLMAAANVDTVQVKGPLGMASVRRGVERLRPALASCYASMAERAGHNHFGKVDVSVVIDETGRVRSPHVTGDLLPGLDSCLANVAGKLVTNAPDTGRASASLVLNFTP